VNEARKACQGSHKPSCHRCRLLGLAIAVHVDDHTVKGAGIAYPRRFEFHCGLDEAAIVFRAHLAAQPETGIPIDNPPRQEKPYAFLLMICVMTPDQLIPSASPMAGKSFSTTAHP
jgi:hypothetical protein